MGAAPSIERRGRQWALERRDAPAEIRGEGLRSATTAMEKGHRAHYHLVDADERDIERSELRFSILVWGHLIDYSSL